jgi:Polyketide cyclase / dehydrase and lipid transport
VGDSRYEFRSTWHLSAAPNDVYAVLERLADYPLWWPQVRAVTPRGDETYEVVCRSSLPYELRFTTKQSMRDPGARILEANMSGDLDGFSRWTIASAPNGTSAVFEEEVVATKTLLRRLEVIARPAFKANHTKMMRDGERGLRTYLAGYRARLD